MIVQQADYIGYISAFLNISTDRCAGVYTARSGGGGLRGGRMPRLGYIPIKPDVHFCNNSLGRFFLTPPTFFLPAISEKSTCCVEPLGFSLDVNISSVIKLIIPICWIYVLYLTVQNLFPTTN